jgi:hypothetical protein
VGFYTGVDVGLHFPNAVDGWFDLCIFSNTESIFRSTARLTFSKAVKSQTPPPDLAKNTYSLAR